jgi:hypothetical protein
MGYGPNTLLFKNGDLTFFGKKVKKSGQKIDFSKRAKTPQNACFDTFLTFSKNWSKSRFFKKVPKPPKMAVLTLF